MGRTSMGRTFRRIGVAMAVAVLSVAMGRGSDAAPLQDEPDVIWTLHTTPTCPSLHGDSINGGQGSFLVQGFTSNGDVIDGGGDVLPDHPVVVDLSPLPENPPGLTIHRVVVYNIDVGVQVAEFFDVQVACAGATAPSAPRQG